MIHTTQTYQIGDNVELMRKMSAESIDTIVTSPPYWGLRDYGVDGQIGREPTLDEYHARLLEVTAECMRVLKPTGVMFWNHGDSYGGSGGSGGDYAEGGLREGQPKVGKGGGISKCMTMQNERLILKMVDDQGWILRNRIIWNKPNGMPSSVTDRFSNKYEPVYMLVKSKKYWFDLDAARVPHKTSPEKYMQAAKSGINNHRYGEICGTPIGEKSFSGGIQNPLGKNPGDVVEMTQVEWINHCHDLWDMFAEEQGDIMKIATQPYPESHFATFPTNLIEPMIKAACPAEICPVCGLARERITEPSKEYAKLLGKSFHPHLDDRKRGQSMKGMGHRIGATADYRTVGWTSCECDAGWIAGTVLDPFCGSGTVLEVCRLLNRNAIGLELNPEYAPLIKERSMSHTPPLTAY